MNDAELHRQLTRGCAWWRDVDWALDDPDLRPLRSSPIDYRPDILGDIRPDGLYVLRGLRRVGKSVEVKRAIDRLLRSGVEPRRIIHVACDTLTRDELRQVERVARDQATRGVAGPRYWFLDEITAVDGWPGAIKWLRDNTAMRDDCVVLTGSSARDLHEARDQLAGRRGSATTPDRILLPMSFREFCRQLGDVPDVPVIRASDFLLPEADDAIGVLGPWLDELASAWEVYCRCGGLPPAVAGQKREGDAPAAFVDAMFDVVHGDALRRFSMTVAQTSRLLEEMSRALSSFTNFSHLARELGGIASKTAEARVESLIANYLVWPCWQRGGGGMPELRSQRKLYFTDPLLAHLGHRRDARAHEPDTSTVSEQQLGLHLMRAAIGGNSTLYDEFASVMCVRTANGREVDFVGPSLGALGFEGKYADRHLQRESQTVRAACDGKGVLASRSTIGWSRHDGDAIRFLPVSFVAYLLA